MAFATLGGLKSSGINLEFPGGVRRVARAMPHTSRRKDSGHRGRPGAAARRGAMVFKAAMKSARRRPPPALRAAPKKAPVARRPAAAWAAPPPMRAPPAPMRAQPARRAASPLAPPDRGSPGRPSRSRSPGRPSTGEWYDSRGTRMRPGLSYAEATGVIASGDMLELEVTDEGGNPQGLVIAEVVGEVLDPKSGLPLLHITPLASNHAVTREWMHPNLASPNAIHLCEGPAAGIVISAEDRLVQLVERWRVRSRASITEHWAAVVHEPRRGRGALGPAAPALVPGELRTGHRRPGDRRRRDNDEEGSGRRRRRRRGTTSRKLSPPREPAMTEVEDLRRVLGGEPERAASLPRLHGAERRVAPALDPPPRGPVGSPPVPPSGAARLPEGPRRDVSPRARRPWSPRGATWSLCKGRCGYHISSFPVHEAFHASDVRGVALEEFCCRLCYLTYEHQSRQGKKAKHRPYRDVCWHSYYCEANKTPHSGGKGQRGQDERDAEDARLRGIDRRCGELWLLRTRGIKARKPCPFVRLPHVVVRPKLPHCTVRGGKNRGHQGRGRPASDLRRVRRPAGGNSSLACQGGTASSRGPRAARPEGAARSPRRGDSSPRPASASKSPGRRHLSVASLAGFRRATGRRQDRPASRSDAARFLRPRAGERRGLLRPPRGRSPVSWNRSGARAGRTPPVEAASAAHRRDGGVTWTPRDGAPGSECAHR